MNSQDFKIILVIFFFLRLKNAVTLHSYPYTRKGGGTWEAMIMVSSLEVEEIIMIAIIILKIKTGIFTEYIQFE